MPTLYVERVPADLYEALRARARENHRSIAAETISILQQVVPTRAELKRRERIYRDILRIRRRTARAAPGPPAQELLREDRAR